MTNPDTIVSTLIRRRTKQPCFHNQQLQILLIIDVTIFKIHIESSRFHMETFVSTTTQKAFHKVQE